MYEQKLWQDHVTEFEDRYTESRNDDDFNPRSHERSDSNIAQKICLFLYNTDNKYIIR